MRKFNINVNGKAYAVEVEELGATSSSAPVVSAPAPVVAAPAPAAAPAPVAAAPVVAGEGTKIECPMPGTIIDVKVAVGDAVKAGQPVVILEAMKMENDIVASIDGKVTSVVVKKGDTVNAGDVLVTIA